MRSPSLSSSPPICPFSPTLLLLSPPPLLSLAASEGYSAAEAASVLVCASPLRLPLPGPWTLA